MTVEEFEIAAKRDPEPKRDFRPSLAALWYDIRGEWEAAHTMAQEDAGTEGAWVHAYLHRREGDSANAAYWYGRAKKPAAKGPLDEERKTILRELLLA
jgi:hypothetical protein